jgi:hypothetical protein
MHLEPHCILGSSPEHPSRVASELTGLLNHGCAEVGEFLDRFRLFVGNRDGSEGHLCVGV